MKSLATVLACAMLVACGAGNNPAKADDLPNGPVSDLADILPAETEARLDRDLREYWDSTGNALVVATVTTLGGRSIDKVSLETARRWGIGDAETKRGLMIMVAPNERSVRIEVSCGLENVITDERAAAIIQEVMIPIYKRGDMAGGTVAGAEALIRATSDHAADLGKPAPVGCLKEAA